ncbi:MAG: ATP-binding protein [Elusimicrobia bacterium]|nr:ATP-binding protein [Elusimicrobiota bacterium]
MYKRILTLAGRGRESCFLWGPRQTGKSTLLQSLFPRAPRYDLLLSNEYGRLSRRPALLREELAARASGGEPVLIDEIQKIPGLLDEVQWLIVNRRTPFILCGSSARKLKRGGANLLGGRALRFELFPLVSAEIEGFDLLRALNNGLLPRHYPASDVSGMMEAYIGDYLKEEIAAEALTRNIPAFSRFLEAAAFSNGETVSYTNIASECGVSLPTARQYFEILEDTLLGRFVPAFQRRPKRRVIAAPRFYFFDVGLANFLLKRGPIRPRSEAFGKAFEHFIFQEVTAHSHYSGLRYPISYWRTTSQIEADFILGDHQVAVEVKGVEEVAPHHLKGLKAFREEYKVKHSIVVSMDVRPRLVDGISILPWDVFLHRLWKGEVVR